ncbi:MAG: hypothetical protein ACLQIB_23850 [Isosphaeraceae bacterium]
MATRELGPTTEIRNIQRQMAQARRDIHQDVGGAMDGVHALTEWRTIVRSHPWLSLAMAAALGFAAVPRRSSKPRAHAAGSATAPDGGAMAIPAEPTGTAGRGNWEPLWSAYTFFAPIVLRLAQGYASQYLESWLAEHTVPKAPSEPESARGESGGGTPSPARPMVRSREVP